MKEVEVLIGIILIVTGAIFFEMNWGFLMKLVGLMLLIAGVFFYILAVDSLDEIKKKREKKKQSVLRILP